MTEIEFSIYGDQPSPLEGPILREFEARHQVHVRVNRMAWDDAWPRLFHFAVSGGGPDISHIGALWTSTLVAMNALRPFAPREIAALGGTGAFFAPTWQGAILPGQPDVWAIPFTAYTYIVLYRRDLLQRAGVAEQTAFGSAAAMAETLRCLQAAGVASPWVLPSGNPYRARVHIAASWIWGAGGDFVGDDGKQVLFDQPGAHAGMKAFFDLYRYLVPSDYNLTYDECLRRFALGHAAVTIADANSAATLRNWGENPIVLDNLGVAAVPGIPWIGGSNIVIWREAQARLGRERMAVLLTSFLVNQSTQIEYATASNSLPARIDALPHLKFEPASLGVVLDKALRTGRSYRPALVWVRMLNDLSPAFDAITADVLANPVADTAKAISQHLDPLTRKFRLMWSV
jgi:multiple sugar transport system substrate-binding protein